MQVFGAAVAFFVAAEQAFDAADVPEHPFAVDAFDCADAVVSRYCAAQTIVQTSAELEAVYAPMVALLNIETRRWSMVDVVAAVLYSRPTLTRRTQEHFCASLPDRDDPRAAVVSPYVDDAFCRYQKTRSRDYFLSYL